MSSTNINNLARPNFDPSSITEMLDRSRESFINRLADAVATRITAAQERREAVSMPDVARAHAATFAAMREHAEQELVRVRAALADCPAEQRGDALAEVVAAAGGDDTLSAIRSMSDEARDCADAFDELRLLLSNG